MNCITVHERRLMKWIAAYAFCAFWAFWLTTPARAHETWIHGERSRRRPPPRERPSPYAA